MNKIKIAMLLGLVFLLTLTIVACGSETTKNTTESTTAATTPVVEEGDATTPAASTSAAQVTTPVTTESGAIPEKFSSLKVGETPLSEYTIVYAQSPYAAEVKKMNYRMFIPVYDFDHETADRLSDLIFEVSGIRLKVAKDVTTKEGANEILVGKTNRDVSALSLDTLKTDDYVISVAGTKLVICGGAYGTTWHALDYLETFFETQLAERHANYAFASDYHYQGNYHLVQIGCIGDSITQGVGATDQKLLSYPAQMGRYLWKDAIVTNFGSSGATMRSDFDAAYTKRGVYTNAVSAARDIDIFTIMLGTNDSNLDRNWNADSSTQYINSCVDIFKTLFSVNKDLRFVLANCPAYFGNLAYGSQTIRNLQDQLLITLNGAGYPTTFYDMYSVTKTLGAYFTDQLHPNNMGHMLMAEAFAEGLMALINPAESEAK